MTTVYIFTKSRSNSKTYTQEVVLVEVYNTRKEAQTAMRKKLLSSYKKYIDELSEEVREGLAEECDGNFFKEIEDSLEKNPNYFWDDGPQEAYAIKKAKYFN